MIMVDVGAGLDQATGIVTLTLEATDPATGTFPEDPLVGLLYPDDGTGRGSGSISYIVKPKAGLPSGTVIQNRASIVFDYNDPIDTPLVKDTLDSMAPTSSVAALPATTTDTTLTLNWSGQDEAGGSGIASYTIYASVDGAASFPLLTDTTATTGVVTVEPGHTYAFYSVATDNVGHVEAAPAVPDATIQVIGSSTTTKLQASEQDPTYGDSLTFTATVAPDPSESGTPPVPCNSSSTAPMSVRRSHWLPVPPPVIPFPPSGQGRTRSRRFTRATARLQPVPPPTSPKRSPRRP